MTVKINKINTLKLFQAIDDKLVGEVAKVRAKIEALHVHHTGEAFKSEDCPCLSCTIRSMISQGVAKDVFPEVYNSLQIALHNCKGIIIEEYNKLPKVEGEDPCQVLWMLLNPLFDNRQIESGNTFAIMNLIDDMVDGELDNYEGIQEYYNVAVAAEYAYGGISRMLFGNSESSNMSDEVDDLIESLRESALAQLDENSSADDFADIMRAALLKAKESGKIPEALREGLDSGKVVMNAVRIDLGNKPTLQ